ncbi:metallophosphoesterase [Ornithinicoccus hortensis]|uniref:Nuclease SbcCD subunit D n=1 Tax=Ornithinicoccus hortensis TaxID=82346 RepID=A0A542YVP3_9MICO|nr:metallophosphoesterase [Ornithinicoccus hortensis]TQL52158.1 DNA repair exonuclease SbcCD nuclease subunit [Ornithinicoccus hortensis]
MVRFLHTADWQIGMTRRWLPAEAQARYAAARVEAVRRIGEVAAEQDCEFVVVCGDVFETNQLSRQTVRRTLEALADVPVPVYLLPGNHDPLDAATIYRSDTFLKYCPAHVVVLDGAGPVTVREGVELVAAPWGSKHPDADLVGQALATVGPADGTVRIVVGHGAVDLLDPDRHNRAGIALAPVEEALAAGRIHYVALGDRHSRTDVGGSGAVWYSGTPEVTDPREQAPGDVLVVTVGDGSPPRVDPHQVGTWSFRSLEREITCAADVEALDRELSALPSRDRTVVRVSLRGALGLADHARLEEMLAGHGEVLAALHTWERHHHVAVIADDEDLGDLGWGGFVAAAAEEIRGLGGAAGAGAAAVADVDPEAARDTTDEIADGDDLAGWHHETEREWDGQSAQDALALLYRLSTQGAR